MSARAGVPALLLATGLLAAPAIAPAQYPSPGAGGASAAAIDANGNPFSGNLAFDPARVKAKVGQEVSWRNTDSLVPHTATELHGLWDVAGSYGLPGQTGFAPGETAGRRFEAGTHVYYCRIHPDDMRGRVDVPVKLRLKHRKEPRGAKVLVKWATGSEPGTVFDVQRRRAGSPTWLRLKRGTTARSGSFDPGASGGGWQVRARMRSADDPSAKTDWSPPARI
jgi:plastocyanin